MSLETFARLIDDRLGIIRRVGPAPLPPYLPQGLCQARAEVADSRAFSSWTSDAAAGGLAWWNESAALAAAAGEAVERYCGNLVPAGLRRASFAELAAAGEPALDPADLALYSAVQYESKGFPFLPFGPDLRVLWAEGREMATRKKALVPASLVWTTWQTGPTRAEPKTNGTIFAGIAAGPSREEAERGALAELAERDAVHLAWTAGAPLPRLIPPAWMRPLLAGPGGEVEVSLYQFPSDLGLAVLGALLRDRRTGGVSMGCACRTDPIQAALKAMAEAAQLALVSRALAEPESGVLERLTAVPGASLRPWRADGSYAPLYGPDWREARDLLCNLQIYLDPEMLAPLEDRLASGLEMLVEEVPSPGPETLETYLELLAVRGLPAVSVDITTPEVAAAGLAVVRVIVPGLYSNAPQAFPFLGGARLAAAGGVRCTLPPPYA